jgi:hypothetical protein
VSPTRQSLHLLVVLIAGGSCSRKTPKQGSVAAAPVAAIQPANSGCGLPPIPMRIASKGRVIAFGDIHGDLPALKAALRAGGVVDASGTWNGGTTVVVQTGDILDRGDDEQAIMDWLGQLEQQASKAGGAMIWLLGNHELMNAAGDFRYVTPGGFSDFADDPTIDVSTAALAQVPTPARARVAALSPGGRYAKQLSGHNVVAIVDDVVYSHAGVIGPWASKVEQLNGEARCWLDAQIAADKPPVALTADNGPAWTRTLGGASADCNALDASLKQLGAKRMVVGHTVQPNGISSLCDGMLWRIDVGLAKHYGGPIEVLEIAGGNEPKVLSGSR